MRGRGRKKEKGYDAPYGGWRMRILIRWRGGKRSSCEYEVCKATLQPPATRNIWRHHHQTLKSLTQTWRDITGHRSGVLGKDIKHLRRGSAFLVLEAAAKIFPSFFSSLLFLCLGFGQEFWGGWGWMKMDRLILEELRGASFGQLWPPMWSSWVQASCSWSGAYWLYGPIGVDIVVADDELVAGEQGKKRVAGFHINLLLVAYPRHGCALSVSYGQLHDYISYHIWMISLFSSHTQMPSHDLCWTIFARH